MASTNVYDVSRGGMLGRRIGIGTSELLVLTPGTLWPIKGQALLVDALAQIADEHPRVRLAFIGQQEQATRKVFGTEPRGTGCRPRVRVGTFKGGTARWYRAADVVAVPSASESLPAVALEAMAYQLPVLASRVGDLPELVVEGETGWLCEPSDLGDLAAALRRAAETDREDRERLGRAARHRLTRGARRRPPTAPGWCDLLIAAAGRAADRR